eukprot:SAG11_NODE_4257_length_1983_cov_1.038196_2_plen_150_part_00
MWSRASNTRVALGTVRWGRWSRAACHLHEAVRGNANGPAGFVTPSAVTSLGRAQIKLVIGVPQIEGGAVPITLTSDHTALWVMLTTLAAGRFSDGTFLLRAKTLTIVDFQPVGRADLARLKSSVRVESQATYSELTWFGKKSAESILLI